MVNGTILVGCPVRERAVFLERWFLAIENACGEAGLEASYIFYLDPTDDSYRVIRRWADQIRIHTVLADEAPIADLRGWDQPERIEYMARIRNEMLGVVRILAPNYFWSVDSDIMVGPRSLASAHVMLRTDAYDAVASLTWMMALGIEWPNFGHWDPSNGGMRRFPAGGNFQYRADIIMACKLMRPSAYAVDYVAHHQGEDVGWSLACRDKGLVLGIDGMQPVKHCLGPAMLDMVDDRCGF